MKKFSHISEDQIVELLSKEDPAVMEVLYEKYSTALFGLIYRLVNDKGQAEELLQDTYLKVWNSCSTYDRRKGRLFTWLSTIARNTALDRLKLKGYQRNRRLESLESNATIINNNNQSHINTDIIGIDTLIKELNSKYMTVIDLLYFQGFTHKEAAEELDIPLGTIKTRIKKALNLIRQSINP